MATADDDFKFALGSVERLLRQFRAEVKALLPAAGRGTVLADHVLAVLDAIARKVENLEAEYPQRHSEASKRAGARELRLYAPLVWATHSALTWLDPVEAQRFDLGALHFADELALSLLGPGVEVSPVQSRDYMYSTQSWPFHWLFEEHLGDETPEPERPAPIVLSIPAHERHTMLLHCLFAHELAHTAVRDGRLVDRALEPLLAGGAYDALLGEAVARAGQFGALVEEAGGKMARLWIDELLCDALAFGLLGPSYLLAFAEVGLSVGWAEPDAEHPSMASRTRLLVRLAEHSGWAQMLEKRLAQIWAWFKYAATEPAEGSTIAWFAEEVSRNCSTRIMELSEEALDDARFTSEQWIACEGYLRELLDADVLPVEGPDGEALSHAEIMLGCWLAALDEHEDTPGAISLAVDESEYQRFVAKAIEMSTALRLWEEVGVA